MSDIDHDAIARHARHLNNTSRRVDLYNKAFPARPELHYTHGMVVGTWMIGAYYKNPNTLYGAYPHGYLERVHAMFPDARRILHAFSGGLTPVQAQWFAQEAAGDGSYKDPCWHFELVDSHGPDQGRYPTVQQDVLEYCDKMDNWGRFDLILADPPYSAEDAEKYDCPPPNRSKIMRALRRVAAPGGNLVWLDQVWPMHRKDEWKTWGTVGLVRSTNHRVRLVSFFEAV